MKQIVAAMAALLYLLTPVYAFPAHNPSWVDNPDIPNCTLVGPNSYANNPECETYARSPPPGFATSTGSGSGVCAGIFLEDAQYCFQDDRCEGAQIWNGLQDVCEDVTESSCAVGFEFNGSYCEDLDENAPPCPDDYVRFIITGQCMPGLSDPQ